MAHSIIKTQHGDSYLARTGPVLYGAVDVIYTSLAFRGRKHTTHLLSCALGNGGGFMPRKALALMRERGDSGVLRWPLIARDDRLRE